MAKENQEKELETGIKADASVDVAVEKKRKKYGFWEYANLKCIKSY